jgi:tetratricopeptide (TPR) repeat protein
VLSDQAVRYIALAAQADGAAVLSPSDGGSDDRAVAIGRDLLRVVFGPQQVGVILPDELAELVARPRDMDAFGALWRRVTGIFDADPELESAVAGMLTAFFGLESEAGNTQALVELGDLLRDRDKPEEARDAYRWAAEAGNSHALISLARQLARGFGDFDGARVAYRQAIDAGDPEVAAQALVELGYLRARRFGDNTAAEAAFRQAIATGHVVGACGDDGPGPHP